VLTDWRTAPLRPALRAALAFVEKMTLAPDALDAADALAAYAAGVSRDALEDAIHVCAGFNLIDRVADTFGFDVPDRAAFLATARNLLKRGYTLV
jgi:alkylhydroperoxidase family enzyme